MKVRSVVGLVPLFAIEAVDLKFWQPTELTDFKERWGWLLHNRPDLTQHDNIAVLDISSEFLQGKLLSLVKPDKLRRILQKTLDENEFLSPH